MERARKVFDTLCATLDSHDWHYSKDDEKLEIVCNAQGDDLPIRVRFIVDTARQIILLFSPLPFEISEDKRLDAAIAVSMVNNRIVDGGFDYNIATGFLTYRMTSSFIDSDIGNDLFTYMLFTACRTVDDYNDKFLMLSKGTLGIEYFIPKN